MIANLYKGEMMHARIRPVTHEFKYPIYFISVDLGQLPGLDQETTLFSYNSFNLLSIHDKDYLLGQGTIQEKLQRCLTEADKPYADKIATVRLLTMPRFFNYIFNPVSFFYCYDNVGELLCIVVEVSNTFSEKHLYFLDNNNQLENSIRLIERDHAEITYEPNMRFKENKAFHVSPFNNMEGYYRFQLTDLKDAVQIHIHLHREDAPVLTTNLDVNALPFTDKTLFTSMFKIPFTATIAMPQILWQAAKLYFLKGMTLHMKPKPSSELTFSTAKPSVFLSFRMRLLFRYLERLKVGGLKIEFPDKSVKTFGDHHSSFTAELNVHDFAFITKVIKGGDIGLGESYMDGDWSSPDLTSVFRLFLLNRKYLNYAHVKRKWLIDASVRLRHFLRRNNLSGSRKNIKAHYDLSNDFFETFLDESMTYSGGIYHDKTDTLEQAQKNKLQAVIQKAEITAADHVLEIGSGWGSLAIEAVKTTGCTVTSVTLSEEQLKYAQARAEKEGVSDKITFEFCDYRNIGGSYDKIVSIEMFEAVGHENYGKFFSTCDRLLKPNGKLVMQVISIADQFYDTYRSKTDWIQAYIFPGGMLPSLTAMTQAMKKDSSFLVNNIDNIGIDYAYTLQEWRTRFFNKAEEIKELGFDNRFMRMWEYYLCYSEAGFLSNQVSNYQLVFLRPNEE
ncbi:DUF1365 family protein [Salisediminibacterium halotolerans]|uniref:DUF1365 family protein n=1 Tax=Salisediminibacterium halotolerans TaxID=517425 RepID=UPI000EABA840|nr:DUF1365 family protein [Salisediminibacterium halotolerans]RLJ72244.1 cyclopropane-fatty-acyl-phospholipid synthase [Actinophytocola xinjiangensis]RPE85457.1 cyclopropane-fatty-acyl-phospholipid synthase [Salisediminibacterium halotolerans]TWG33414.1 cyclopropane-fatty-acyl-phospholipid synthase [Salisediminibacterium halotolerans]GEL07864.1 hypothetical protein SHA02_12800 [Salisediminibacterium halotolerans]